MSRQSHERPGREQRIPTPLIVAGAWTAYGLILWSQTALNRPPGIPAPYKPWGPGAVWLGHAWFWAALTPGIALLLRRARPSIAHPWTIAFHLAAVLVIHTTGMVLDAGTMYFVRKAFVLDVFTSFTRGLSQTILLYSAVTLGVFALEHARLARTRLLQAARLESDLTRARLDTLRRQIQPHFLFNTLNTISSLIDTDPNRAGIMVARLGDLLRRSLDDQERRWIPLEAELKFLRLYTQIEQVRFEGWLSVREEVELGVLDACVPPMILQPLVENAIKHGIAPLKRRGTVLIRAHQHDGKLRVEVADDGVGLRANGGMRFGIGLQTTTQRLSHLFGSAAHVDLSVRPEGGTSVSITLPLITTPPPADAYDPAAPGTARTRLQTR